MTAVEIYGAAGAIAFSLALYGVVAPRALLHRVIALNVMGASVFLLFVAAAARPPHAPDSVPHAMVITGIVVTVAATGLAVALIRRLDLDTGSGALPEDREKEGSWRGPPPG